MSKDLITTNKDLQTIQQDWDWCHNLDYKWKKIFNKAIGKGEITDTPSRLELKEIKNLKELDCGENQITDPGPPRQTQQLRNVRLCEESNHRPGAPRQPQQSKRVMVSGESNHRPGPPR